MIKKILLGIILNGIALYVVTQLLSDVTYTGGIAFFIIGGIIIGILNTFVKPLMKLLSFPLIIVTAGLFSFVINIIIFYLTEKIINAINLLDITMSIEGVLTYIFAALIFAVVNSILHFFFNNK